MFALNVCAILLCALIVNVQSGGDCAPKECVRGYTESGTLCGQLRLAENSTKFASFLGVPYGKPPLGELRFKELEPVTPWEGDRDATEESAVCVQKNIVYGSIPLQKKGMSEDCMYMNIHVPYEHLPTKKTCKAGGLPILVVIHGGAFNVGSGLTDLHGPEYLMTEKVIVITFNYRLNVFGFLYLNSTEVSGNQGLRDQRTLLHWVQRNACFFGGDPDNVTLMGQSAGASSAHLLSLSKSTKGLFKRLILMSGTGISNFFTTSPLYASSIANLFLSYLGINSTDPSEIHRQLVQLPVGDIMHANTLVQNDFALTTFVPTVETPRPGVTTILDDTPMNLMAKGYGKDYPVLMGFTNKEAESFRWLAMVIDMLRRVKENPSLILPPRLLFDLPKDELASITQKIDDKVFNGTKTLDKILDHLSYSYFTYAAMKVAEWRSKFAPVYLYEYSYSSNRSLLKEALWLKYDGAGHIEDFLQVFRVNSMIGDHVSFPPKNNDDRMKEWMTKMVANFVRCSNPTATCECEQDETDWPRLSADKLQYQSIAEPNVYKMSEYTAEHRDMIQFIDSIDTVTRDFEYLI